MNITVANLQDNREVFRIFITLLSFSLDSHSYYSLLFLQYNAFSFRMVGILNTKISVYVIFPPIFIFCIFQYFSHYFDTHFRTRV